MSASSHSSLQSNPPVAIETAATTLYSSDDDSESGFITPPEIATSQTSDFAVADISSFLRKLENDDDLTHDDTIAGSMNSKDYEEEYHVDDVPAPSAYMKKETRKENILDKITSFIDGDEAMVMSTNSEHRIEKTQDLKSHLKTCLLESINDFVLPQQEEEQLLAYSEDLQALSIEPTHLEERDGEQLEIKEKLLGPEEVEHLPYLLATEVLKQPHSEDKLELLADWEKAKNKPSTQHLSVQQPLPLEENIQPHSKIDIPKLSQHHPDLEEDNKFSFNLKDGEEQSVRRLDQQAHSEGKSKLFSEQLHLEGENEQEQRHSDKENEQPHSEEENEQLLLEEENEQQHLEKIEQYSKEENKQPHSDKKNEQRHSKKENEQRHLEEGNEQPHSEKENEQSCAEEENEQSHSDKENEQSHSEEEIEQSHSEEENEQPHSEKENEQPHSQKGNEQPHSQEENEQSYSDEENEQSHSEEENEQQYSEGCKQEQSDHPEELHIDVGKLGIGQQHQEDNGEELSVKQKCSEEWSMQQHYSQEGNRHGNADLLFHTMSNPQPTHSEKDTELPFESPMLQEPNQCLLGQPKLSNSSFTYVYHRFDKCTNTIDSAFATSDQGVQVVANVCHTSVNTDLTLDIHEKETSDIYKQSKSDEKYQSILTELNTERSQRMVNDELIKILQIDVTSLQQRNIQEVTNRLKLENEIADLKAELLHSQKMVDEKHTRVTELEESLKGTMTLVHKLEEQSAAITNKGGIDYLLQAKISDGRAREAEGKLEILQAELLQTQAEVKNLLNRLNQLSKDRQEMVSGSVHNKLIQIADERAQQAELKVKELEQEVIRLQSDTRLGDMSVNKPFGYDPVTTHMTVNKPFAYNPVTAQTNFQPDFGSNWNKPFISDFQGRQHEFPLSGGSVYSSKLGEFPSASYLSSSHRSYGTNTVHEGEKIGHDLYSNNDNVPCDTLPTLPLYSDLKVVEATLPSLPPITNTVIDQANEDSGKDNDSSDEWSSSEDEAGDSSLRPSAHMNLRSKFEWLSSQQSEPSPQKTLFSVPSQHDECKIPSRKCPPPIAPKPKALQKASLNIQQEGPVSFEEATKPPTLRWIARPKGPFGKRPPSYHRREAFN